MALEDYLLPKEEVKARVEGRSWTWYATSKRVIRHRTVGEPEEEGGEPVREVFQDVGYGEVSSVYRSKRKLNRMVDVLGGVFVLMGLAAAAAAAAAYLRYLVFEYFLPVEQVAAAAAGVSVLFGLAAIAFNRWRRHSYVRLYGDTVLRHDDGGVWRLETAEEGEEELSKFMKVVRSGSNKRRRAGGGS